LEGKPDVGRAPTNCTYFDIIPIVLSHFSTSSGHAVIGSTVRRPEELYESYLATRPTQ